MINFSLDDSPKGDLSMIYRDRQRGQDTLNQPQNTVFMLINDMNTYKFLTGSGTPGWISSPGVNSMATRKNESEEGFRCSWAHFDDTKNTPRPLFF